MDEVATRGDYRLLIVLLRDPELDVWFIELRALGDAPYTLPGISMTESEGRARLDRIVLF